MSVSERWPSASALEAEGAIGEGLADRLAHAISIVCSPPVLALPLAMLAGLGVSSQPGTWWAVAILLVATTLLPSVLVYALYRAGHVESLDLTHRGERVLPSAAAALSALAAYPVLRALDAPAQILAVAAALAAQLAALALVTKAWKVSYHAATAGGLAAVATGWDPTLGLSLAALAGLVGWARVRLGRHTRAQVVGGLLSALPMLWWAWSA